MRVIIDTNVVVSAALRDRDPELVILFIVSHPEFEWIVSRQILTEYREVLARGKFGLLPEILERWYAVFDTFTTLIDVDNSVEFPRDQKDAVFLACAIAADAEFFITGDRDFTEATKLVGTTILSASMFKRLVVDTWS